jgi:chemotaxis protein MotB
VATPIHQTIIIRRVKKAPHAHHGGAWKVAYADFVTAMMALFMVLWLVTSSEQVKKAIGGYFNDPTGKGKEVGNGLRGAGGESLAIQKEEMDKLKEKLEQAIKSSEPFQKINEHVTMMVTGEGLRVELLEDAKGMFFQSGSPEPTEYGRQLMALLAGEIGKLPNKVTVEGHTDSKPYSGRRGYSNWELSTDRANSARRWMQEHGMKEDQVTQVRGFADQTPRNAVNPTDDSNRRVSFIIQYQPAPVGRGQYQPAEAAGGARSIDAALPAAEAQRPGSSPRAPVR